MDEIPFVCPACRGKLAVQSGPQGFRCAACEIFYPTEEGVHVLIADTPPRLTNQTVVQFGASWAEFDHMEAYHSAQFMEWIAPLRPEDFRGKRVLEAGCGKGRHTRAVSGWEPESLCAVDLSDAVNLAAWNTSGCEAVTCIRANLLKLPLPDASFDLVFCVGVLHHLENPKAGLTELWRVLKPGGTLCLWVYAREGNGWIVTLVDPVRKGMTSKIPVRFLVWVVRPLSAFLYLLLKGLYGPATRLWRRRIPWLPYASYLGKISPFPFREVDNIVLDHLCPPIAHYLSRADLETWFSGLAPRSLDLRFHNQNSWNVVAAKSDAPRHPEHDTA